MKRIPMIESPFMRTVKQREQEQRRHWLILHWAIVASVAALFGWGGWILTMVVR